MTYGSLVGKFENMKPNWSEVQLRCNWLSMDPDGYWVSWELKPEIGENFITLEDEWLGAGDFNLHDQEPLNSRGDWRKSLEKRP